MFCLSRSQLLVSPRDEIIYFPFGIYFVGYKTSKITAFVWLDNIRIAFELAAVLYVGITALFYPVSAKPDFMNVVLVLVGVAVALYVLEIGLTRSVRIGWSHSDRLHQGGEKEKIALAVLTRASFVLWVPPLFNLIAICFFLLPVYMALKCVALPRCTYHGVPIRPDTFYGLASLLALVAVGAIGIGIGLTDLLRRPIMLSAE